MNCFNMETIAQITAAEIYAAYPRKVAKPAALKAIEKALKAARKEDSISGAANLLKAVQAYAEAVSQWPKDARQFVPHPATWFNRGSYTDDPSEWERETKVESVKGRAGWLG